LTDRVIAVQYRLCSLSIFARAINVFAGAAVPGARRRDCCVLR